LPDKDAVILEFGCGTGRHTETMLAAAGQQLGKYVALDVSEGMLEQARKRVRTSKLAADADKEKVIFAKHDLIDGGEIPHLKSPAADLAFCNLVLEHIPDVKPVFEELKKILKPGGIVYICEYHPFKQYKVRNVFVRACFHSQSLGRKSEICQ